jgi:DNA repair photolyase
MNWPKTNILINGKTYPAIAPLIISASRSTDIPAFYAAEFYNCLKAGYIFWTNPFNGNKSIIDLRNTKFIVFWTKNPEPILPFLEKIDKMGIAYYFNYTLNNYDNEGLEPNLPPLKRRVQIFEHLSDKIGKHKVVWRFDPLILKKGLSNDVLIDKISALASQIHNYTNKLVISFVDTSYRKVRNNFNKAGFEIEEFDGDRKNSFIEKLFKTMESYGLEIYTCAEKEELNEKFVIKNKCIDEKMILNISSDDKELIDFIDGLKLRHKLKDKGQRKDCNCMISKDIGKYNTCRFNCIYCYASNSSISISKPDIFK